MRIHGVLHWFNESPNWLTATVGSFSKVCDRVVAVDGRYMLFSHDMDYSPPEESEALLAAAEGVGIPLTLHVPRAPYPDNEVEKKNLGLRLLLADAEPYEDWMLILDADEYIVSHSVDFREQVAATKEDAIAYALEEYIDLLDPDMGDSLARLSRQKPIPNSWRVRLRAMYRILPEMQYVGTHHTIGGRARDGSWTWLWGHEKKCAERDMRDFLVVRHRNLFRPAYRKQAASAYYADRDRLQIEVQPN